MRQIILNTISAEELTDLIAKKISEYLNTESSQQDDEFLTREETAKLCKVKSLSTLWFWRKKGILVPHCKAGRKPLYKKQEVINFLIEKGGHHNG